MNKLIYLIFLLFSFTFSKEIWEKEIPPSKYLEKLAIKSESMHKNSLKYVSYGSIAIGLIAIKNKNYNAETEALGYIGLSIGFIGLLIEKIKKKSPYKPKTAPGKEFENIKNKDKKEFLAYDALSRLAENSRKPIKKKKENSKKENLEKYGPLSQNIQQLLSNFMTNRFKEQNHQYGMTPYEKVLDNYLNQVPIN